MEPFGLLPFLQSLLREQPTNSEETTPISNENTNGEKAEFAQQSTEKAEENSARQNAAAAFLTAHEKRANRIKK